MKTRRLWMIVLLLAMLTPLGLWLPARFGAGGAWGEWSAQELQKQAGFVPRGLARLADRWKAPAPGYAPPGWERKSPVHQGAAYIASAVLGLLIVAGIVVGFGRLLSKREKANAP